MPFRGGNGLKSSKGPGRGPRGRLTADAQVNAPGWREFRGQRPTDAYGKRVWDGTPLFYWRQDDPAHALGMIDEVNGRYGAHVLDIPVQASLLKDATGGSTQVTGGFMSMELPGMATRIIGSSWETMFKTSAAGLATQSCIFGLVEIGTASILTLTMNSKADVLTSGWLDFYIRDNSPNVLRGAVNVPTLIDGNAHHIVAQVVDASTLAIYVDGVSQTVVYDTPGTLVAVNRQYNVSLYYGTRNLRNANDRGFNGAVSAFLDEFAIYPSVLSQADISDHSLVAVGLTAAGGSAAGGGGSAAPTFSYDASGGAATASGGTASLTETLTATGGSASASGGTAAFTLSLSAASGVATGVGGTMTVTGSFPFTGVLDDFNRADGALGSNWTNDTFGAGSSAADIVSNQWRGAASGYSEEYWNAQTFTGRLEVYATFAALGTGSWGAYVGMVKQPGSAAADGYQAEVLANGRCRIYRYDNAAITLLAGTANGAVTPAAGMKVGLQFIAGALTMFVDPDGLSGYQTLVTTTDSTYDFVTIPASLELATSEAARTFRVDDFGGGTAVTSPTLNLTATGGSATGSGGTAALTFTLAASAGSATASGGTATLTFSVTAAAGSATAGGGTVSLTFTDAASAGAATAGGGTATLTFTFAASAGTATAGGGTAALTRTSTATGGTATAGGGTTALTFTLAASGGTASGVGGTAAFTDQLTAASGAATGSGGTAALTFSYLASGGTASGTGGSASTGGGFSGSASGGLATASGTAPVVTFTVAISGGTATAGGGTSALTYSYSAAGGSATAAGGTAVLTRTSAVSGGAATASGGLAALTFSYLASGGTATADGSDIGLSTGVAPSTRVDTFAAISTATAGATITRKFARAAVTTQLTSASLR